ncbi:hypothetical protein MRB53_015302 [Persea americana]|uniref:Uncharacterized protein n=1 Tax=Persea americana TaxID=3435 RepID=A0ACC2KDM1_PERAE|nr:hypothetical protein MRB53_015302 [Persea americana]
MRRELHARHDLERDRSIDIDRRCRPALPFKRMDDTPSFLADLFEPFIPANLTHMMNMMEQMENLSATERGMGGGAIEESMGCERRRRRALCED